MTKQKTTKAVVIPKKELQLSNPEDVIAFAKKLNKFITDAGLSIKIQNSNYVLVAGWEFAGLNFGLTAIPGKPELISKPEDKLYVTYVEKARQYYGEWKKMPAVAAVTPFKEQAEEDKKLPDFLRQTIIPHYEYSCACQIKRISNGEIVAEGHAICSNAEIIKVSFDKYAIMGMVQTRVISRTYRNIIGYVIKAAGFEDTPAEEAEGIKEPPAPATETEKEQAKENIIKTVKEQVDLMTDPESLSKYAFSLPQTTQKIPEIQNYIKTAMNEFKRKNREKADAELKAAAAHDTFQEKEKQEIINDAHQTAKKQIADAKAERKKAQTLQL